MNVRGMRTGRDVVKLRVYQQAEAAVLEANLPDLRDNTVRRHFVDDDRFGCSTVEGRSRGRPVFT